MIFGILHKIRQNFIELVNISSNFKYVVILTYNIFSCKFCIKAVRQLHFQDWSINFKYIDLPGRIEVYVKKLQMLLVKITLIFILEKYMKIFPALPRIIILQIQ